jgi:FkbM family methyltransferase
MLRTPVEITAMDLDTRIAVHHVGARGGAEGFFELARFARDYALVMYDADAEATADVSVTFASPRNYFLPYCLGATDGPATLNITFCPYMSSVYPIAETAEPWFQFSSGYDYNIARAGRAMETRAVDQVRLDSLAELRDGRVPPPTILVMDTQGSEADIIRGGAEVMREHTLAVVVEAEFTEMYAGQPLFGDVSRELAGLGFVLAGFIEAHHGYAYRQPLAVRGPGFLTGCDALFLRRISTIESQPLALLKLGVIALLAGHSDYALDAWSRVPGALLHHEALANCDYAPLVRDVLTAYDATVQLYPKTFEDFFSWELSRGRFDRSRHLWVQQSVAERAGAMADVLIRDESSAMKALLSRADTPLEAALRSHALARVAEQLKAQRLAHTAAFLSSVGIEVKS